MGEYTEKTNNTKRINIPITNQSARFQWELKPF